MMRLIRRGSATRKDPSLLCENYKPRYSSFVASFIVLNSICPLSRWVLFASASSLKIIKDNCVFVSHEDARVAFSWMEVHLFQSLRQILEPCPPSVLKTVEVSIQLENSFLLIMGSEFDSRRCSKEDGGFHRHLGVRLDEIN